MSETAEPKPTPPVLSGRIGKYEILKILGKGAMGMVYVAHDTVLERDVALKVMGVHIADDETLKQRFMREAKAVAKMTHPNVVNVFDLGSHVDGSPYIAMELLHGEDLLKSMRTPPGLPLERKVEVIVQVLAGLAHAHKAGIVHRDIKPANVFICQDGTVKLMDFGVARLTSASMTGTGHIVGTADYMSPEQVRGLKVDGRSDLFSVGSMLFELLTGQRPFHAENLMAIFYRITQGDPDFNLVPAGAEYEALMPMLHRALAKNVEERYQTAYDFAVDLRDWLKVYGASTSEPLAQLTEPQGPTLPGQRQTLGSGGRGAATVPTAGGRSRAATRPGSTAPTVRSPAAAATAAAVAAEPRVAAAAAAPPAPAAEAPAASRAPLGVAAAIAVAGFAALAGYLLLQRRAPAVVPTPGPRPVATLAAPPTTVAAAPPTTLAGPPPTVASAPPPPTAADTRGRGAVALRAAQVAFKAGQYDRALAQAQAALAEDPENASARKLVDSATRGQQASTRLAQGEAALRQGDFARARSEAEAGRELAPWDARGPDLLGRVQRAEQQASQQAAQQAQAQQQAQLAARLSSALGQADAALSAQKYDDALKLYDEVLKQDPQNQHATLGRTSALGARAVAQAASNAAAARPAVKAFVAGKTVAQGAEATGGSVPAGFEPIPGVEVKRGTQSAELPGKISFAVDPDSVKPGERYTVRIFFLNEGTAPIQLRDMRVTTRINGRAASGPPLPPLAKEVAPQQKALLRELPDFWKEDTSSWTVDVTVATVRGERYTNQLTWKQP
ncbi:MAG TPA: serine/threonine-protein kinase [Vicinamibacteria bacterium]